MKEKRRFSIEYYETAEGECPFVEFLAVLSKTNPKLKAKLLWTLDLLQEEGNELEKPYSEYLEDGIFEVRCQKGSNIARALYYFRKGRIIIVTGGFVKKTQKTPRGEIETAKNRRKDYEKRNSQ